MQRNEEINDCDSTGHKVTVYTQKIFCHLIQEFFLKHLSSLSTKSKHYSVAFPSLWQPQNLWSLATFTDCKSHHLIWSNWAVKSALFISIQQILRWLWFLQQQFQMSYWGSLVRSHQRELLLFKTIIQHLFLSPYDLSAQKVKSPEAWCFPAEGQVPAIPSLITQLFYKNCAIKCVQFLGLSLKSSWNMWQHLFCLLSTCALSSFERAMSCSYRAFWKKEVTQKLLWFGLQVILFFFYSPLPPPPMIKFSFKNYYYFVWLPKSHVSLNIPFGALVKKKI